MDLTKEEKQYLLTKKIKSLKKECYIILRCAKSNIKLEFLTIAKADLNELLRRIESLKKLCRELSEL